jgi:hypothetical protein
VSFIPAAVAMWLILNGRKRHEPIKPSFPSLPVNRAMVRRAFDLGPELEGRDYLCSLRKYWTEPPLPPTEG